MKENVSGCFFSEHSVLLWTSSVKVVGNGPIGESTFIATVTWN